VFPGGGFDTPGLAGPGTPDVQAALGLQLNWTFGGAESGQLGAFFSACLAVATGSEVTLLDDGKVYLEVGINEVVTKDDNPNVPYGAEEVRQTS
jgi:hypothetical protein